MRVVGHVEIDPFARSILDKHWPEVPSHDDVRTCLDWWRAKRRPPVHVVAGGFPCQGHSVAGKQRGTSDERWGWPWFREVVEGLRPPIVLIENVPNLVRTGLVDVLQDLASLGFDAWWNRVPAAALGAPHLRWRLFVVAAHPERVKLRHEPGWSRGADGEGPTVTGHDGATWTLADTNGERRNERTGVLGNSAGVTEPANRGRPVADAERDPRQQRRAGNAEQGTRGRDAGRGAVGPDGLVGAIGNPWAAEPDVGRVAHGVPARVDRLRVLGNAVVPQVAEYVGRMVLSSFTIRRRPAR
jgi:DNA (cytosine-5)-methyltransferase 1